MAIPLHVRALDNGVESWNDWRRDNRVASPDLSGANLTGVDLSAADLSDANLSGT